MIEFAVIGVAIADRFLLKRKPVKINLTKREHDHNGKLRFVIKYSCNKAIKDGLLTYSIRNKSRPNAVLVRTRKLDFSSAGINEEYLTFSKKQLESELGGALVGEWILDVKIQRSCSRINPLYKIFPLTHQHKEVFRIA